MASNLGALTFDPPKTQSSGRDGPEHTPCLLCEQSFCLHDKADHDLFLKHLLVEHKLVIADVKLIADFPAYIQYWRKRLEANAVTDFCTAIQTNSAKTDKGVPEMYYLLADVLSEDKQLRIDLQRKQLERVLSAQARERGDACFSRGCLFCRAHFTGNRAELFNHLNFEHNLGLGHADNLVFTDELLDVLQAKLDSLLCLYCEKTFKDRGTLKEHMRKKNHKRINPRNTEYDKYYIINYLELGKNWEEILSEEDDDRRSSASATDEEWSDWRAESADLQAVCLFCEQRASQPDAALLHMKEEHSFDLATLRRELDLSFYHQIKLINYIRRQVHGNTCPLCEEEAGSAPRLRAHLSSTGHAGQVPARHVWDQPQYYFPTFENDNLLCALEDDDSEAETVESRTETAESRTGTAESNTETVESRTETAESKTRTTESRTGTVESRTETVESRTGTAKSRSGTTESRTGTVESRSGTVESLTGTAESRSGTTESRTGTVESRSGTVESRTGTAESRTGTVESRTGIAESRSGTTETPIDSRAHIPESRTVLSNLT